MKLLRIDLTDGSILAEDVPKAYRKHGGRGLTSTIIKKEVPPTCDPLGPENKLIIAPGLLSGTTLVNSGRVSIGAKSPLTGGIKESNAGGTVATALANIGVKAVVIEGKPAEGEYYLLIIDANGAVTLKTADDFWGMRTYALAEKLLAEYGEKNSILCIGPAGEQELASASIQVTDTDGRPCRAAGRGGLGAVMGAKGLKAIVIDRNGKNAPPIADPEGFKKSAKIIAEIIKSDSFSGEVLPAMGTAALVSIVNTMGAFPNRNATQGQMKGVENISGEKMVELIGKRGGKVGHRGCSQCIIRCSNEYVDEAGKYITASLEYETIWAMGGMTDIADLDTVAKLDFMADDIGLDTMNTGVAFAVAMDAGYKEFGDKQAVLDMMEEIAQGTEVGKILGNGPVAVGKYFNHPRVPTVKNQSIAAYDPRAMQGNGVTYATSPMGADHTAGNLIASYLGGKLNPLAKEGQVHESKEIQIAMAFLDCTGLCLFAAGAMEKMEGAQALINMINAMLGTRLSIIDILYIGKRILKSEKDYNAKAGLTNKDDRLAEFFYKEPLPPHNKVFEIGSYELDAIFD